MENQTSIIKLLNSLSTSDSNNYEILKRQVLLENLKSLNMKLPVSSSKLLERLIKDDNISPTDFREKFEQIIASTNTWTWKLNLFVYDFFEDLKKFIFQLYWTEIVIFLIFFFIIFLLDKKFNIHKPFFWFKKSNEILFERIFAFLGFFVPYLDVCDKYLNLLLRRYPYLNLLLTDSIRSALDIYSHTGYSAFFYIIILYGVFLRNKWPESRFVRFNWMYGLLIVIFQSNFGQVYYFFLDKIKEQEGQTSLAFIGFFLNMIILIPCMFRALLGRYPSNAFIRDNIEIHLGRDGPDFKWWDR